MPSVNVSRLIELLMTRYDSLYDIWLSSKNNEITERLDKECQRLFQIITSLQATQEYDHISVTSDV